MRISHANECSFVFFSVCNDCFSQHSAGFCFYLFGVGQQGSIHVYGYFFHQAVFYVKFQYFDSRKRIQCYHFLIGQLVLIYIFTDAAGCVSTHHCFRAVGIKYAHAEICLIRFANQDQAVGADTCMVSTPFNGGSYRVFNRVG